MAILFAQCYGIQASNRAEQCEAGPKVTVYPLASWQTQHPYCTATAEAYDCSSAPDPYVTGSECYPSSGTVDIAHVLVEDGDCSLTYLVRADGGVVQVVMIDP
jgi:hypothetical protein